MQTQTFAASQAAVPGIGAADMIAFGPTVSLRGVRVHFERNAEIFGEDEPAEYVYRIVTGAVRAMRFSADGKRQILGFYLPGDVFGLETHAHHTLSAEAVAGSEIVMVRRSCLEKAASEDMSVARAMLALTAQQLDDARAHAVVLGRKGAGERVAAFLLSLADRFVANRELDLPMSRADIADYLGLTIETVSRMLTQLQGEAIVEFPSTRRFQVRKWNALEALAA